MTNMILAAFLGVAATNCMTTSIPVTFSNKTYELQYYWFPEHAMVPATYPAGVRHYEHARIVLKRDGKELGSVEGTYAPGCSMCDDPKLWTGKILNEGAKQAR